MSPILLSKNVAFYSIQRMFITSSGYTFITFFLSMFIVLLRTCCCYNAYSMLYIFTCVTHSGIYRTSNKEFLLSCESYILPCVHVILFLCEFLILFVCTFIINVHIFFFIFHLKSVYNSFNQISMFAIAAIDSHN